MRRKSPCGTKRGAAPVRPYPLSLCFVGAKALSVPKLLLCRCLGSDLFTIAFLCERRPPRARCKPPAFARRRAPPTRSSQAAEIPRPGRRPGL